MASNPSSEKTYFKTMNYSRMPSIVIVGMGAAGLLLLHMFQAEGVSPDEILCIDPFFDGGDLQRQWRFLISNTPWSKVAEAIKVFNPAWKDVTGLEPTKTTPLHEAIRAVRKSIEPYLHKCHLVTGFATNFSYTDARESKEPRWKVQVASKTYESKLLFLCFGSQPKTLALPIPSIPLSTAIHLPSLMSVINKRDRVILFGTMHSGALILQNLDAIGCTTTAIYKGAKPFFFARDGEYDGIKEDAAAAADAALASQYKNLELVPADDMGGLTKALRTADWVIYAIGFEQRTLTNSMINLNEYNGTTGRLSAPSCWGFGIAFPNTTTLPDGSVHKDVSLLSFATHISKQRQDILGEWRQNC
jgi:hypothetical protein